MAYLILKSSTFVNGFAILSFVLKQCLWKAFLLQMSKSYREHYSVCHEKGLVAMMVNNRTCSHACDGQRGWWWRLCWSWRTCCCSISVIICLRVNHQAKSVTVPTGSFFSPNDFCVWPSKRVKVKLERGFDISHIWGTMKYLTSGWIVAQMPISVPTEERMW